MRATVRHHDQSKQQRTHARTSGPHHPGGLLLAMLQAAADHPGGLLLAMLQAAAARAAAACCFCFSSAVFHEIRVSNTRFSRVQLGQVTNTPTVAPLAPPRPLRIASNRRASRRRCAHLSLDPRQGCFRIAPKVLLQVGIELVLDFFYTPEV